MPSFHVIFARNHSLDYTQLTNLLKCALFISISQSHAKHNNSQPASQPMCCAFDNLYRLILHIRLQRCVKIEQRSSSSFFWVLTDRDRPPCDACFSVSIVSATNLGSKPRKRISGGADAAGSRATHRARYLRPAHSNLLTWHLPAHLVCQQFGRGSRNH